MKKPMLNLCGLAVMLAGGVCLMDSLAHAAAADQNPAKESAASLKPADTEQWEPVPPAVLPGVNGSAPPADAIILFDGRNLDEWVMTNDRSPARWRIENGTLVVDKEFGNIETKRLFKDYQLHIEWRIPANVVGEGQERGNSGLFLASTGPDDQGYEIQILDSWKNKTYVNGQAASVYKQSAPLVNASRKPGVWQSYDVVWTAPDFRYDGTLEAPASVTVFHNGVLVQNHFILSGETRHVGKPVYRKYDRAAIKLQSHHDPSAPISFRNIWVRELPRPDAVAIPAAAMPKPPQVLYKGLFNAVQSGRLFADSKTFADAVPKAAPEEILARYRAAEPVSREALKDFVEANFVLPVQAGAPQISTARDNITSHIDSLWNQLTRSTLSTPDHSSLLALPQPYVVPGGRFREMYYWDSYFTMLGLVESGRQDLAEDMVRNFAYLIATYGHVPNGTRTYYLSRSQPPFFSAMVALLGGEDAAGAYARYLPALRREYAYWMQGEAGLPHGTAHRRVVAMPDGGILNRYWDDADTPRDESYREDSELARHSRRTSRQLYRNLRAAAESGWDFSSRWFADGHSLATIDTTEIVPIDLNSLLFGLEEAIGSGCARAGDTPCVSEFTHRAAARRGAVNRYLWDASGGVFRDYRWVTHTQVPRVSAATLYPLFVALATEPQAAGVASAVSRDLLKAGGIVTTPVASGQQWDAPNGWAPLQWIGVAGLLRYSILPLAETIACRWMMNVNRVYGEDGKLVEKYDVIATGRQGGGGEYPLQDGFGWTNGVMRKLMTLYPDDAAFTEPEQCRAPAA